MSNLIQDHPYAIGPKWLIGLQSELLCFTHHNPIEMLIHLRTNGATLQNINIQELTSTLDSARNPTKNHATKFKSNDKVKQQLTKVGVPLNPKHHGKCSGIFNAAMHE